MAIALPLIVELFHSLDRAVQWLSGGAPEAAAGNPRGGHAQGSAGHARGEDGTGTDPVHRQRSQCMPLRAPAEGHRQHRQWRGPVSAPASSPLRLHPARRPWQALRTLPTQR